MALLVDIEKHVADFHLKVSFHADTSVLALLGASGCGKSMTLKCIAGIEKPDFGKIVLNGRVLFDSEKNINLPPQKRRVGYLFQQYALFPNMTVAQNICCGIRNKADADNRLKDIVRKMHIEGLEQLKPFQLSGGQQQRVALARILVNEPEVLLLDEPFSALDSHLRFQLEREVSHIVRDFSNPVILVSHDRDEVFRLSDRIAVMNLGAIDVIDEKHQVFVNPRTVTGARLTGCKNISRAKIDTDGMVYAPDWGVKLKVPVHDESFDYIGIRLHDVRLGNGENSFCCRTSEVIENPFSYTVMLSDEKSDSAGQFGIQVSKQLWETNMTDSNCVMVSLPPEKLLLLRG